LTESLPAAGFDSVEGRDPFPEGSFSPEGGWNRTLASWRTPEKALEEREFWDVLDGCLGRLPRALSSAFVLRELEGLEMTDLRRTLGLSEVNLRVRLHRARLLLRECLERRWFGRAPRGSRRTK
jgi:RNA polymerase sigma-70 factor (ECF subfamily)